MKNSSHKSPWVPYGSTALLSMGAPTQFGKLPPPPGHKDHHARLLPLCRILNLGGMFSAAWGASFCLLMPLASLEGAQGKRLTRWAPREEGSPANAQQTNLSGRKRTTRAPTHHYEREQHADGEEAQPAHGACDRVSGRARGLSEELRSQDVCHATCGQVQEELVVARAAQQAWVSEHRWQRAATCLRLADGDGEWKCTSDHPRGCKRAPAACFDPRTRL